MIIQLRNLFFPKQIPENSRFFGLNVSDKTTTNWLRLFWTDKFGHVAQFCIDFCQYLRRWLVHPRHENRSGSLYESVSASWCDQELASGNRQLPHRRIDGPARGETNFRQLELIGRWDAGFGARWRDRLAPDCADGADP
jgi:hypothetical protein